MELIAGKDDTLRIVLDARMDARSVESGWRRITSSFEQQTPKVVCVDGSAVDYCDGCGLGLLVHIEQEVTQAEARLEIRGLNPKFQALLDLCHPGERIGVRRERGPLVRFVEEIGNSTCDLWRDLYALIDFMGDVTAKLLRTLLRPRSLRWRDTLLIAEKSGADAVGITTLLGLLIGLILAFQAAVAMKQFGAEVFVADLVVLTLFRELGPLITAFILASRSGSAFAAELGTMQVNEEVDALKTMGLDPVRFLVLPRMVAAVLVVPLLTIIHNLAGLVGCGFVMSLLGYPLAIFVDRLQFAASLGDLTGGLIKTVAFGILIGGIGCLRGLQTKKSASGVGDAATRAVVSSIVAIVVADGVFAVLFYTLGW